MWNAWAGISFLLLAAQAGAATSADVAPDSPPSTPRMAAIPPDASAASTPATITAERAATEPAPAAPSGGAAPTSRGIGEIVVTAERRAESANDIPLSITAVAGEDLKSLGIEDTRQLGHVVPGFVASDSGYSVPVFTLRGVGFNDISYSATGTVGVYLDEIALPYALMTKGANLDLQRVEVLKGPQGTLYGRNATGGAINYIAKRPTGSFDASLSSGVARFGVWDASGFISGPLTEHLRGRFAATATESSQGWQESITRDDELGKADRQAVRAILDWDAADDVAVSFTLSGWRDYGDPVAPFALDLRPQNGVTGEISLGGLIASAANLTSLPLNAAQFLGPLADITLPGTVDPAIQNYPYVPGNDDPRAADWAPDKDWQLRDTFWMAASRAQWDLSDTLQATGLLSYGHEHSDHSLIPQGGLPVLESDQDILATLKTIQGEVRLSGQPADAFDWIAGISGNHDETDELHIAYATHNSFNFGPPVTGNPTGTPLLFEKAGQIANTKADSAGAFLTGNLHFAEGWTFTQGVRFTQEKRTYEGCTYEPVDSRGVIGLTNVVNGISLSKGGRGDAQKGDCFTLDADGNPGLFHGTLKEHNWSTRSVIDWKPFDDGMIYFSYVRGYKSGGFPVIIATDQSNFEPATQERLVSYEVGGKFTLPGHWAHVDLAAFHYDYKDKQLLTYRLDRLFGALPLIRNAPKSEVDGGEISLVMAPTDALTVTMVGSYIETRIIEFTSTTARGEQFDFHGRPFNYAPKVQAAMVAAYAIPLLDDYRLTPSADLTYASSTNATLEGDPTFAIDHYVFVGARLVLERGPWTFAAFGRNLTNELQRVGVFRTGDTVVATAAYPRTYGIALTYDF